jgi:hypothetical protein
MREEPHTELVRVADEQQSTARDRRRGQSRPWPVTADYTPFMTHTRFVDHTAILLSISLRRQYRLVQTATTPEQLRTGLREAHLSGATKRCASCSYDIALHRASDQARIPICLTSSMAVAETSRRGARHDGGA